MKKVITIVSAMMALTVQGFITPMSLNASEMSQSQGIQWQTDYQRAVSLANEKSLPVILFFTGSDWCSWCHKLEQEVLDTPQFASLVKDKYLFVMLDYPMRSAIAPQLKQQNAALKDKFGIKGFPSIVIIDGQENVIGKTGYNQGGGQAYAAHLSALTAGKSMQFTGPTKEVEKKVTPEPAASELSVEELKEQYRHLVKEGSIDSFEAQEVREKLLASGHRQQVHYDVALVEFEALALGMEQGHKKASDAVEPLIAYLETFGTEDATNGWKVEMTVAQVYFENDQLKDALEYANRALEHAPTDVKEDVKKVVSQIESTLGSGEEVAAG